MIQKKQHFPLYRFWQLLLPVIGGLLLSGCGTAPTLPQQTNSYADCWPCAVYTATFEMVETTLRTLMENACETAMLFLGFGLAFWLLIHVTKFAITIQTPSIQKFVEPLWSVLFKAMVVAAFLTVRTDDGTYALVYFIGENIIQPFMDFFSRLSTMILDDNTIVRAATQASEHASDLALNDTYLLFGDSAGRYLDLIYRIYVALKLGISLGFTIWQEWSFTSFFFGLFTMITFWMLLLTVPMMFIDSIVRICAAMILLPFALVGWVFPGMERFLVALWKIILGAGIMLVVACFYIVLLVYTIMSYAEKYYPGILGSSIQQKDPLLIQAVQTMSSSLLGFFVLIICMQRLSGSISKIANHIGGSSAESSFLNAFRMGKTMVQVVAKLAIAAAMASPTLAKDALNDTKKVAQDVIKESVQGGREQ